MHGPVGLVRWLDKLVHWVELIAAAVLAVLSAAAVVVLCFEVVSSARNWTEQSLPQLFGGILLVFIMLELYGIAAAFIHEQDVADKVFEVGLTALVRQVIVAEFLHTSNQQLLTLAALILALGIAWFLSRRAQAQPHHQEEAE